MSSVSRLLPHVGSCLLLLGGLSRAIAQLTDVTCLPGYEWMTNSRGQNPCLVEAYLHTCDANPTKADVHTLKPNSHYILSQTDATDCMCNTVAYSLMSACSACQGANTLPWTGWTRNCTNTFIARFPRDIPPGTAIPAWAYFDVTKIDSFNVTAAEAFVHLSLPDSTAPAVPVQTPGSNTSTASDPNISGIAASLTAPPKNSNGGIIAGGVFGGIAGLAVICAPLLWWMIRRRMAKKLASLESAPEAETVVSSPQTNGVSMGPWRPPVGARLYNPNDPTTFPVPVTLQSPRSAMATINTPLPVYDEPRQPIVFRPFPFSVAEKMTRG